MAKNLLIVESPAKARTLERYLGRSFKVAASMGHVRDLPKSKLGVDIENNFAPRYITIRGKGKVLDKLRKAVKSADKIYLATDPDREGEAIAWHLQHALKLEGDESIRVTFNEITKSAVKGALKKPRTIDRALVDAQQARRILDRLVGYKLSPLLWKKVRPGLSAGRVQSGAVKMIVDRERERDAFVPEEYWTLEGTFSAGDEQFNAKLAYVDGEEPVLSDESTVEAILERMPREQYQVVAVDKEEKKRYPSAPFNTSSLQQEASRRLRMKATQTMRTAQQLYEGLPLGDRGEHTGLITYMRTDATRVSREAVDNTAKYVRESFGARYSEPRVQRGKARGTQDAHEAIRPTDVHLTPDEVKPYLNSSQQRLYTLIWQRFVASQMTPAIYDETTVSLQSSDFVFQASGKVMKFPGFRALFPNSEDDNALPLLEVDARVNLLEILPAQHFTQPPARYTEASLVRALEEEGIGRPSTYAPIIDTVQRRGYVALEDNHFLPTELGQLVNELLEEYFADVVDLGFTAEVEEKLDEIEEGDLNWTEVVEEFWKPFSEDLDTAEEELDKVEIPEEETDIICEKCGRTMVVKYGRYGKFIACPGYPECKNSMPYFEKTDVTCPVCGGEIIKKFSRKGKPFWGCSNYPECDFVVFDEPSEEKCPDCGSFMVKKRTKKKGAFLRCSNKECGREVTPAEDADLS
ncbi:MAG: type I DNA topoisomerase [Bacillota bacterium]